SLNYALRDVATVIVAIAILGEPIAASVLARILLNEPILAQTVYGGILILVGVFITVYFQ
ncbi:EamA family transporter, partial [candidate division KSB1 bacterium]|nr:EamA family transporter [candidate division KSB1 bacterium]NIS24942.1 EamA family transporter [candidate division KSB1 bacterium]NIT71862.1 EamA family transporter [candidate division KSB1 bacterium]NIU25595.1 EamA family transporter [candidate division KSB1 bacterium]NIV95740.1 EamA family transporter [candidate division KSB1 bacterium]